MKELAFKERVVVNIYLVGYYPEGESIIFNILADNKVVYTGVIDSYKNSHGKNYTAKLLDFLKINHINLLCWTHPDEDHSKGFEDLFLKTNESSYFCIPSNLVALSEKIEKQFPEVMNFIHSNSKGGYRKTGCHILPMSAGTYVRGIPFQYLCNDIIKYKFDIVAFSPNSEFTSKSDFGGNALPVNDYSIGLWVTLGELSILFTGDIGYDAIVRIDKWHFPESVDYIKIPHHGSEGSLEFVKLFNEGEEIVNSSCTTIKQRSKLPKRNVIDEYRKISKHVVSTNGKKDKRYGYGISKVSIDCTDKEFRFTHRFIGDADEI